MHPNKTGMYCCQSTKKSKRVGGFPIIEPSSNMSHRCGRGKNGKNTILVETYFQPFVFYINKSNNQIKDFRFQLFNLQSKMDNLKSD